MSALTAPLANFLGSPMGGSLNATLSTLGMTSSSAATATAYGADLYAGVDPSMLNVFERWWMSYYIWIGNPVIATGLFSFVMHEVVYFGRGLPWLIIDAMPSMRKYKIQEDRAPTKEQQWHCIKSVLLTHFTVEVPQIWSFHPICEYLGMTTHQVPFPSVWKMAAQIAVFFVFEDMFHYWAHRALHWGPLYKHIHKRHHEFSAPFGLAAEYAHPLEILILGMGTLAGPFILCAITKDLHIVTMYIWVTLRLFQAIDAHSGYDLPISMHNWIPFWAGADHHDHHHMAFVGCYATSFRWWDHFMGTDASYRRYRARQADEKRKAKEEGLQWPVKDVSKTATGAPLKPKPKAE